MKHWTDDVVARALIAQVPEHVNRRKLPMIDWGAVTACVGMLCLTAIIIFGLRR